AAQAARLGIEVEVAAAVLIAESSGSGYGPGGRLKIRFEPGVFRNYTGHTVADSHAGQEAEYAALEAARCIDETAAYRSISMGAAQIMGFNAERIGFASARAMFEAFGASEERQLQGMFDFIAARPVLVRAACAHDWKTFAHHYNGPGYSANRYDAKLE